MRPLLCVLQYINTGKCRHLYSLPKFLEIPPLRLLNFQCIARQRTIRLFRSIHSLFT